MSRLLRFLGLDESKSKNQNSPALAKIEERLDMLPPDRARFYAAFAYVLVRVAGADLDVDRRERAAMKDALIKLAGLSESDAGLVVELAEQRVDEIGASSNYLVTRAFREVSTPGDRVQLIECLYAVAAADDNVSLSEGNEIMVVAEELSIPRGDVLAIRSRHKAHLAEFKKLAQEN